MRSIQTAVLYLATAEPPGSAAALPDQIGSTYQVASTNGLSKCTPLLDEVEDELDLKLDETELELKLDDTVEETELDLKLEETTEDTELDLRLEETTEETELDLRLEETTEETELDLKLEDTAEEIELETKELERLLEETGQLAPPTTP
jgi:hypothetical protein